MDDITRQLKAIAYALFLFGGGMFVGAAIELAKNCH